MIGGRNPIVDLLLASATMTPFDLVIANGTLVTASEMALADLGVIGDKIAAIGHGLEGRQRLDASGKLVLPGAVDPHVHLGIDAGATRSSDDFETGTIAAACGGTTTIIDFVEPEIGGAPAGRPPRRPAAAAAQTAIASA